MTQVARTKIIIDGWAGGPGVNVLAWTAFGHAAIIDEDVDTVAGMIGDMLDGIKTGVVGGCTLRVDKTVNVYEDDTGELVNVLVQSGDEIGVTASGADNDGSRAQQVLMQLRTSDIVNNRLLRGRMFVGPASNDALDGYGNIAGAVLSAWPGYFSGLISSAGPRLGVWHRPHSALAADGHVGDVTSVTVWSKPGILRSRR